MVGYRAEDFGPDTSGTIAARVKALLAEGHGPDVVATKLRAEEYEVTADVDGYMFVSKGMETCSYPLKLARSPQ